MTEVEQNPEVPPLVPRPASRWSWIAPTVCFVSGSGGFFYEGFVGHDLVWGFAFALWAAGGPSLVADRMLRSLR